MASSSSDVTVMIGRINRPPSVSAGADQTVPIVTPLLLNGVAGDDGLPAGNVLAIAVSPVEAAVAPILLGAELRDFGAAVATRVVRAGGGAVEVVDGAVVVRLAAST